MLSAKIDGVTRLDRFENGIDDLHIDQAELGWNSIGGARLETLTQVKELQVELVHGLKLVDFAIEVVQKNLDCGGQLFFLYKLLISDASLIKR